jgi:hypothetical protein
MQTARERYRCVIDGLVYEDIEAVAAHLRMQHNIKRYEMFVARPRQW